MRLTNDELRRELDQLVAAMEESLAVIAGTIAETGDPQQTLMHLCAAKQSIEHHHGPNAWRDRLLRSALKICALKVRSSNPDDPALQSLAATVLGGRQNSDQTH